MGFTQPVFLFAFLPAILLLYHLLPHAARNALLLLASLLFYAWGEPIFILVALVSALLDLAVVRAMLARPGERWRHRWLVLGVLLNLGLLAWYKYAGFAYGELSGLLAGWLTLPPLLTPALPIAVSFIVFEKITYIVDVYRGDGPTARPGQYLLYVFLFPKLMAGPILQYHDLAPQLSRRAVVQQDLAVGLLRFSVGLAKKLLIADSLADIVDHAFGRDPQDLVAWYAWLGALAFILQIYFDFSGYSDMAIGLARCFGFRLRENFRQPLLAESPRQFWSRWHISLVLFIRDYLYRALRGNQRRGGLGAYVILWICFLATGLWHGANWTFIVWGVVQGIYLTVERLGAGRLLARLPRWLAIAITFLLITLSLVIFRAETLGQAMDYFGIMFGLLPGKLDLLMLQNDSLLALAVAVAIAFLPGVPAVDRLLRRLRWGEAPPVVLCGALVLMALCLAKALALSYQPFLYFRF